MEEFDVNRIFCANCYHCKIAIVNEGKDNQSTLKVRCTAGMWKKKIGEEKFYRYDTVEQRRPEACEAYEPMGELDEYMKELRRSLPSREMSTLA